MFTTQGFLAASWVIGVYTDLVRRRGHQDEPSWHVVPPEPEMIEKRSEETQLEVGHSLGFRDVQQIPGGSVEGVLEVIRKICTEW